MWLKFTHVCRNWRAIVFASSSRLGVGITLGPKKPGHIRTILSSALPIFLDYYFGHGDIPASGSALWRMRAALEQPNRVRGISLSSEGPRDWFDELFRATSCSFPILETLVICSTYVQELNIPDTFLGGPNLSNLHLQHLELERVSLTSISGILLSASALTFLSLHIDTPFGTSPETSLLACLQGMLCLNRLSISCSFLKSPSSQSTPSLKGIVPLSELTFFDYVGHSVFLDAIVAGLSAPFLSELRMKFRAEILSPTVHLPRFIDEVEKQCHSVDVDFKNQERVLRLSLYTQSGSRWLHSELYPGLVPSPESVMRMSGALTTKLATAEKLQVTLVRAVAKGVIPWRGFYQLFPSVKMLRTRGTNYSCIARTLLQDPVKDDDVLAFLPALEEIELGSDGQWKIDSRSESELAAFNSFISARQQAGFPVRISWTSRG
jgi:hypothetical protein